MNRIIEIVAMSVGGLSLFLVCFVGFASLSGRDVSQVAVIGKLFPAPAEGEHAAPGAEVEPAPEEQKKSLSDAAVIEASLGVLSAWTLPSPYSSSELRVLSEEIKKKHAELEQRELALARRERAVVEDEGELEERLKSLEELRAHIETLQSELAERAVELTRQEDAAQAGKDSRWAEVAGVIGAIEEPEAAAKRLQEFAPDEAAKVLRALGDDARAGEILNQVQGTRWKEYVDAYTAEKARAGAKGAKPRARS
jgi:flagellar motility protein MotE (MotC chaperone)